MPRYFFCVRNGDDFFEDFEGDELADEAAAKVEAAAVAADLARHGFFARPPSRARALVEVFDEGSRMLCSQPVYDETPTLN
ncbi:hypothetical protein EMQ25_16495 [Arsenicitalea aurantiaca]|uniref:DUF6894 domain-containing protein n=1 Tax=Arsenicitalea aurantiaca TaxID=1783274 RepID=A0A433X3D5_9HYPH|nr:hypothetical protein [Arsenicitalea aurantiaca]RUT28572.1 hypothetical protein EMQ25_16495 [Arsenicitalea aurantiaca]